MDARTQQPEDDMEKAKADPLSGVKADQRHESRAKVLVEYEDIFPADLRAPP